jgi:hypothetical protein
MSTRPTAEQIVANADTLGKALVRLLEVCDVLLERNPAWTEQLLLRLVQALYTSKLRRLVAVLLANLTAQILSASEKMSGVVIGFSQN